MCTENQRNNFYRSRVLPQKVMQAFIKIRGYIIETIASAIVGKNETVKASNFNKEQ